MSATLDLFAPAPVDAPAARPEAGGLRPRWYQTESFRQIRGWWEAARAAGEPFARGLVDWATGAGKGFAALEVVNAFPELVRHGYLFLVEYDSIVWQQAEEFRRAFPDLRVDVEKANHRADFSQADIVVASVQTLGREDKTHPKGFCDRLLRVPPMGVVAYDEAHRLVHGGMGDRVLSHLGMSEGKYGPLNPAMRPAYDTPGLLLLYTATPNRTDGQGLHFWAGENHTYNPYATDESLTDSFDLHCLIGEGFLVGPRGYHVYTDSDLSDVSVRMGKFNDAQLKEAIATDARNVQVVKAFLDYREQLPTGGHAIFFTRWVDHAYELAQMLRDVGVAAEAGDGSMPRYERQQIEKRFKNGETRALVNCLDAATEVLTQRGWQTVDTIQDTDEIANWWEDGAISFEPPKAIVSRQRAEGERMVSVKTLARSIRLTEGHHVVYKTGLDTAWKKDNARDVVGRKVYLPVSGMAAPRSLSVEQEPAKSEASRAKQVYHAAWRFQKKGLTRDEAYREAERRIARRESLRRLNPSELSIDECAMIGFWIGDGSKDSRQGARYSFSQSTRYTNIVRWFDGLVHRLRLEGSRRVGPPRGKYAARITWSFGRGTGGGDQERRGMYPYEPYLEKDGSELLWGLSAEQFESLLYGLWMADGSHGDASEYPSSFIISSGNKGLCDLLQAIAACRGFLSSLSVQQPKSFAGSGQLVQTAEPRPIYTLNIRKRAEVRLTKYSLCFEEEWQSESVWCVTTTSGNIVTRRDGRVTITGNCNLWSTGFNAPLCDMVLHVEPTMSQNLYSQRVGRASRATCDLRGLEGRHHRDERLARIAASEKPAFLNIDFIDQMKRATHKRQPLVTVCNLFGVPGDIDPKGRLIKEVKDRVEQLQREHPTKNILDGAKSLEDVEVRAERVDVWDVLETSPEVLALSDKRWMKLREGVIQLQVPESKGVGGGGRDYYARAVQEATGMWRVDRVFPGYYDTSKKQYVPESTAKGGLRYDSDRAAVAAVDAHVDRLGLGRLITRGGGAGKTPTDKQVRYMKRLGFRGETTPAGRPVDPRTGKQMDAAACSEWIDAMKSLKMTS